MKNDPLAKATAVNKVGAAIDAMIEKDNRDETPRGHLGMSSIGADKRTVWHQYRWSFPNDFTARTLRIFELGNVLEEVILDYLQKIGVATHGREPDQISYSDHGGHFAGSLDGAGLGFPGAPKSWHVIEVKTANDSRFNTLKKDGYKKWSATYYAQIQLYMHYSTMKRAIVFVYNKNTSEIYVERLEYKKLEALGFVQKALEVLDETNLPASTYPDRSWYEIANYKSEEYQAIYWGDELPANVNCRNCVFSVKSDNAEWGCKYHHKQLTTQQQYDGCHDHNWLPQLLLQHDDVIDVMSSASGYEQTIKLRDGKQFVNSPDDAIMSFRSDEIRHLYKADFVALSDDTLLATRKEFGARITNMEKAI